MSIADLFRRASTPPAGSGAPQQPNPNAAPQQSGNPSNGTTSDGRGLSDPPATTGPNGKMPGTPGGEGNPLDIYTKLYENATKPIGSEAPKFELDANILKEVAGKIDFRQAVSPELLQKATTGDAAAMLELINQVGQQAYSTALSHGSALTDAFVSKRAEYDRGAVGASVKGALTMQELSNAPNFDHPVIKNELRQKASQLARSFPDKSPQEIASMAKQYMIDVASALSPSAPAGSKPQDGDFDWDKWLSN